MSKVNLNAIDLNLLPPLDALLRHRNVTRAAAETGMSQPAMSRALARLRALLADPLLVRGRGGLILTPHAEGLRPRVAAALGGVGALLHREAFDPKTAERTVRIAATDAQTTLLGPAVAARLARDAPNIQVRFEAIGPDVVARMEEGRTDLTFALTSTDLPPGALSMPFANDAIALVMRRGHPAAQRRLTLASYAALDHAVISIMGDARSEVDAALAAAGVTRRIAFVAPHFAAVLATVAATDYVTAISRRFAEEFTGTYDVVLRRPPLENIDLPMTLVWSHVRAHDPLLTWMREVIRTVAADVYDRRRRSATRR